MHILLRGISGAIEILKGKLLRPVQLKKASIEESIQCNSELADFLKTDNSSLLILMTNIMEDVLQNAMRFTKKGVK